MSPKVVLPFLFFLLTAIGAAHAEDTPWMEKISKEFERIQARLDNIEKQLQDIRAQEDKILEELNRVRMWVYRH